MRLIREELVMRQLRLFQIQVWVRSLICRKELSKLSSNVANQKQIVGKGGIQSIIALVDDKDRIIHLHAAAALRGLD